MTDKTASERMADAILDMTYSELMQIADDFAGMYEDLPRNLESPREWAEILHSWAEGNAPADEAAR